MEKRIVNAKQALDDIKAGMDDAALMGKYQLSEKGLQSLFKKLVEGGVLKQEEVEKRTPLPEKAVVSTWKCPICGNPQNTQYDKCPECSVIAARFQENVATTQQLGSIEAGPSPSPGEFQSPSAPSDVFSKTRLDKLKEALRNPYGLALVAIAALMGFIIGAALVSSGGPMK